MLSTVYFQYPTAAPYVAGVWLVLAVFVIALYRRQTRKLDVGWHFVLPTVRVLALSVLAMSVVRPVISRRKTGAEQGPVLIVLDATVTMGIVDNSRSAGQWVAIAAAAGRLPGNPHDADFEIARADCDRLTGLADELNRARAAVDYAKLAGRGLETASAGLTQAVADLHKTARDVAGQFPASLKSPDQQKTLALLINEPAQSERDSWMGQARERTLRLASDVQSTQLTVNTKLTQSDPAVRDAVAELSDQTRLQLSAIAAQHLIARMPPDIAVRVISIGDSVQILDPTRPNPTITSSLQSVVSRLSSVLTGGGPPPRAVVIFSDGRHCGNDLHPAVPGSSVIPVFTVDVASQPAPRDIWISSMSAPALIFAGHSFTTDSTILQRGYAHKTIEAVFTQNEQPTTRRSIPLEDRPMSIKAEIAIADPGPYRISLDVAPLEGEASIANNHAERWVKVIARRTTIAVIAASTDSDARAAVAAWSNRPGIDLIDPGNSDLLAACDLIVLFDFDPADWTPAQWQAAESAVADRGGSIVWVAGDNDRSTAIAANATAEMLIGSAGHQHPAWITRPGGRATYHAVFPGADDRDALAAFARFLPVTSVNGHRTILNESESGTPVLSARSLGRGKMFAVTASDFTGDSAKLWNELLKNAVDDPYEACDDSVAIDSSAIAIEPGQSVRVRLRLFGPGSATLRVTGPALVNRDIFPAGEKSPSDGRFTFNVADIPEGDQSLQAIVDNKPIGPAIPLHVHPDPAAGLNDLAGDENSLRHLADTTNGRFLRLDQLETLPSRLADLPADTTHPVETPLWDTPLLFGLVVGLFVLEWTLRKAAGLT